MLFSANIGVKAMLALAALSYRGFGSSSEAAIESELHPWLPTLEDEGLGCWELAWGPAAFRAQTSLFDDAMVYVVRREDIPREEPAHYAIAIRGTNPVSAFNWVFGDFFVQLQVPWASNRPTAGKLSGSTALGLAIVRHLSAQDPPSQAGNLAEFGSDLASELQHLAQALPELLPGRLLDRPDSFTEADLMVRLGKLTRRGGAGLRPTLIDSLHTALGGMGQSSHVAVDRHVFDRLLDRISAAPDAGETLLAFLERVVPPNAHVAVAGHSKGGALAIATALWLEEVWAAERGNVIECFSFAGPTAGDTDFARYYDTRLGARTYRITNDRDVVPRAWAALELLGLREFYPELARLLEALATSVQSHSYSHVGGKVFRFDRGPGPHREVVQRIIHEHLDAYLAMAAFRSSRWNAETVFLGSGEGL